MTVGVALTALTAVAPATAHSLSAITPTVVAANPALPGAVFGISTHGKLALAASKAPISTSTAARIRLALGAVLALPTAADRNFGVSSAIPRGTVVRGIFIRGTTVTVDLNSTFAVGSSLSLQQRTGQFVFTLTAIPGVERVAFRINGHAVTRVGINGQFVGAGVGPTAFSRVTPAALVLSTRPGTHVTTPIRVSGVATSFEAVVHWRLTTLSGTLLRQGTTMATSNLRGNFTISIPTTYHGSVHLVVGGDAPRGDVPMNDPAVTPLFVE